MKRYQNYSRFCFALICVEFFLSFFSFLNNFFFSINTVFALLLFLDYYLLQSNCYNQTS